jgi:hypothetical protein
LCVRDDAEADARQARHEHVAVLARAAAGMTSDMA